MGLPDKLWKSTAIQDRLTLEAEAEASFGKADRAQYWFIVPEADDPQSRKLVYVCNYDMDSMMNVNPHEIQQDFCVQFVRKAMREMSYNGYWMCGWTHPPAWGESLKEDGENCWNRLCIMWADEDGDIQFTYEIEHTVNLMMQNGIDYYIKQSEDAYLRYLEIAGPKALKENLGIKENQQSKEALKTIH